MKFIPKSDEEYPVRLRELRLLSSMLSLKDRRLIADVVFLLFF